MEQNLENLWGKSCFFIHNPGDLKFLEISTFQSIPKSAPDSERTQSILPTTCPHMVSLHRFFETDSCVFLLLQYASGGKLWAYIGDYLHTEKGFELTVTRDQSQARNIYSGTKVENDTFSSIDNKDGCLEPPSNDSKDQEDNNWNDVNNSEGLGVVRFSELQRRKDSASSGNAETHSVQSENKNCHNCVHFDPELVSALPRKESVNEAEGQDQFNDSALESVPRSATKAPLNRRLSNLSDDVYAAAPSEEALPPPTGVEEDEEHFQKLLGETHHNIEDFSINSFDSGDVPIRMNSSSSSCVDRIPSIPEDPDNAQCKIDSIPETEALSVSSNVQDDDVVFATDREAENGKFVGGGLQGAHSGRMLATRQISADQVSTHTYLSKVDEDLIREAKKRHVSVEEISPNGNHHSVSVYAPTFNSDDLLRCSRDLLRHVDSVLSETDTISPSDPARLEVSNVPVESETDYISPSDPATLEVESDLERQLSKASAADLHSMIKQPSSSSHESSAEEPSIYDLNRSSDDDPDESVETDTTPKDNLQTSARSTSVSDKPSGSNLDSEKGSSQAKNPPTSAGSEKTFNLHSNPRLSLNRLDSKDLTRSASFECDLKSPTRNRARTVAAVFERLDSTPADHIRIPESSIKKWTAQMVTAVARLHSLGIVCRCVAIRAIWP